MSTRIMMYLYRALVMLLAIPCHEAAHAWVSLKLGDSTGRDHGRLTLNPMAHFDPLGAACMILAGVGWARPVPVNAARFRDPKRDMALSALAGPVANLLLAYISMIGYKLLLYFAPDLTIMGYLMLFCYYMVVINVTLAVFNMLPVPPFDGSRILLVFLPRRIYFGIMKYERYIFIGMFLLLAVGVLDGPLYVLQNGAIRLLDNGTRYIELFVLALRTL